MDWLLTHNDKLSKAYAWVIGGISRETFFPTIYKEQ